MLDVLKKYYLKIGFAKNMCNEFCQKKSWYVIEYSSVKTPHFRVSFIDIRYCSIVKCFVGGIYVNLCEI
jgi:hypothetical protein